MRVVAVECQIGGMTEGRVSERGKREEWGRVSVRVKKLGIEQRKRKTSQKGTKTMTTNAVKK